MRVAETVEVPITCPRCYRPVLVRTPYLAVDGDVEVAKEPVRLALHLHVTRGCEAA